MTLLKLLPSSQVLQVLNKKRFINEYGPLAHQKDLKHKPIDYQYLFHGNIDDNFKLGISFSKRSIKLYSEFYHSDIIIASPLALRTITGAIGDQHRDYDFLSSIEILILDQSNILLMQNIEHLYNLIPILNNLPYNDHQADFSRIKSYFLNGYAKYYKQCILFSSYKSSELSHFYYTQCNMYGKLLLASKYHGILNQVIISNVRQIFQQITTSSLSIKNKIKNQPNNPTSLIDARFEYFKHNIYPKLKLSNEGYNMIFINSYFDFVKIRNYFKQQMGSYFLCSEYTSNADIARSRTLFFNGSEKTILTTERFYYYKRYIIRGIKKLYFYSLPENMSLYYEIINSISDRQQQTVVISLYDQYDLNKLERIMGTTRCNQLYQKIKANQSNIPLVTMYVNDDDDDDESDD